MSTSERASVMRALAAELRERADALSRGVAAAVGNPVHAGRRSAVSAPAPPSTTTPTWPTRTRSRRRSRPTSGSGYGLLIREPVGVVGAIIPWNGPDRPDLVQARARPCSPVARSSSRPRPRRPAEGYLVAEVGRGDRAARRCAQRRDRRSRGLRAAGPRPARRQDHLHRLDRGRAPHRRPCAASASPAAPSSSAASPPPSCSTTPTSTRSPPRWPESACRLTGQVCSSLTRIIVDRTPPRRAGRGVGGDVRHGAGRRPVRPGDRRWARWRSNVTRDRVEGYIATRSRRGGAAGDRRWPARSPRPWLVRRADACSRTSTTHSTIAREEIFGPVLSVIPADDEDDAVAIANDTIYGLNASVFTPDVDRALAVAPPAALRHGRPQRHPHRLRRVVRWLQAVRASAARAAPEDCCPYLETKYVVLDGAPTGAG